MDIVIALLALFIVVAQTFVLIRTWRVQKKKARFWTIISIVCLSIVFVMMSIRRIISGEH